MLKAANDFFNLFFLSWCRFDTNTVCEILLTSDAASIPATSSTAIDCIDGLSRAVKDWARLFMIPGMTHCAGGPSTDQFDMLAAIVAWVENGAAPERIVARGDTLPGQSRPLCASPNIARYVGGDTHNADSFRCQP